MINAGYNFKSTTDTEVILAAYDFWGKECVKKFNGMWAFCIVDMQKESISYQETDLELSHWFISF